MGSPDVSEFSAAVTTKQIARNERNNVRQAIPPEIDWPDRQEHRIDEGVVHWSGSAGLERCYESKSQTSWMQENGRRGRKL